jgi:hypothetical protein
MSTDEVEDYFELRDPKVKRQIAASRRGAEAGRTRLASEFLAELKGKGKGRRAIRKRA